MTQSSERGATTMCARKNAGGGRRGPRPRFAVQPTPTDRAITAIALLSEFRGTKRVS